MFIKIGVGVLRKPDNAPYQFSRAYPILETGVWLIRPYADGVDFVQELKAVEGYGYVYTKRVRLIKGRPELVLEHSLKNTGRRAIHTSVYNHDFYVIDGQPTGPATSVRFPFQPHTSADFKGLAEIRGNEVAYLRELASAGHETVAGYLTGFGATAKDYDIRVENSRAQAGVQQTGNLPLSKLYLWSIRTTVCPEAYLALDIEPKKTAHWRIKYRFYTLPEPAKK